MVVNDRDPDRVDVNGDVNERQRPVRVLTAIPETKRVGPRIPGAALLRLREQVRRDASG
jgi:hypothetical protein